MDKKQFKELQAKAKAGDAVALWKVGETYRHGNKKLGIVRDEKKGWGLIEKAKDKGSVVASYLVVKRTAASSCSSAEDIRDEVISNANSLGCVEFAEFELMDAERSPSIRRVKINSALVWYRRAVKYGVPESELSTQISLCLRELGATDGDEHPVVLIGEKKTKIRDCASQYDTTFDDLEDIVIADGVVEIGASAFYGCALKSVRLPASLKKIGSGAFAGCSKLMKVCFSDGLEFIGWGAFQGCRSLKKIELPVTVTAIRGDAFRDCSSLETFTFPPKITALECAVLRDCKALKKVEIPEGVTVIEQAAFEGCESIERMKLPTTVEKIMWSAFEGCKSLVRFNIPPLITKLESGVFDGCQSLAEIDIPASVKHIDTLAFRGCARLKHVSIPNGLTEIGYNAFEGCTSLTEVVLPKSVTEIGRACFKGCGNLKIVSFHKGLTAIGESGFEGCIGLTEVALPSSVKRIGRACFKGCVNLERFSVPERMQCVPNAGVFDGCSKLSAMIINGTLIYLSGMTGDVAIPTGVREIGEDVFRNRSGIISIKMPDSVISIGSGAFDGCSGLKNITIPTGVERIGTAAFRDCASLVNIEIPANVQRFGNYVFSECASLRNVKIEYGALKKQSECVGTFEGCPNIEHAMLPCYLEPQVTNWFDKNFPQKISLLSDSTTVVAERCPVDMIALAKKMELETTAKAQREQENERRKHVLTGIDKDIADGRTIPFSALSARAQKQALACGLSLTDVVTYKHEASCVLHCPCAMQLPALERVSVKVPRSMLSANEPDYVLVYLDEKREKNWLVLPMGESTDGVEVYSSATEAKTSRFGALVPVISSARTVGKTR